MITHYFFLVLTKNKTVTSDGLITNFEGQLLHNNKEEEDKLVSGASASKGKRRKETLLFHSYPASALTTDIYSY